MTSRSKSRSFAFVSSTLGATLTSILAAWVVTNLVFAPIATPAQVPAGSSSHHYQISPIPPGADWSA
jgi:hypothetical protein